MAYASGILPLLEQHSRMQGFGGAVGPAGGQRRTASVCLGQQQGGRKRAVDC